MLLTVSKVQTESDKLHVSCFFFFFSNSFVMENKNVLPTITGRDMANSAQLTDF